MNFTKNIPEAHRKIINKYKVLSKYGFFRVFDMSNKQIHHYIVRHDGSVTLHSKKKINVKEKYCIGCGIRILNLGLTTYNDLHSIKNAKKADMFTCCLCYEHLKTAGSLFLVTNYLELWQFQHEGKGNRVRLPKGAALTQ